jgi:hypothetical protein
MSQGLKARAFSVPKNPLAGHSAQGELSSPRCGISSVLAPPVIEEIHESIRDDTLEFGVFRDANSRRFQLKLNP